MSKKNQMALRKTTVNPAKQKEVDNRSDQLNPNNNKYMMSLEKSAGKPTAGKDDPCDWDEDTFGDDWEFNYD